MKKIIVYTSVFLFILSYSEVLAKKTSQLIIKSIKFEQTDTTEKAFFYLTGDCMPKIFPLEDKNLRLVCDFSNINLDKKVEKIINTNGRFIKSIRTAAYSSPKKIRAVIDLIPNKNYDIQPFFAQKEHIFILIVKIK